MSKDNRLCKRDAACIGEGIKFFWNQKTDHSSLNIEKPAILLAFQ